MRQAGMVSFLLFTIVLLAPNSVWHTVLFNNELLND